MGEAWWRRSFVLRCDSDTIVNAVLGRIYGDANANYNSKHATPSCTQMRTEFAKDVQWQ